MNTAFGDGTAPSIPAARAIGGTTGRGAWVQGLASALWIPQAALLALAVQRIADGGGLEAVSAPALGLLLLAVLRATLEAWGARRVYRRARALLSGLRAEAAAALAARSPLDRDRPASGLAASVLAEQAEAVVPWLVRFQTARRRVTLVAPLIVLAVLPLSWVAALILVLAMPLIPLFMVVIGWRAKAASEAQMIALGGMNGFLLDRLRGLSTLRALDATDATAGRLRASAEALRRRTMRVLRIAFLSSASLELFSALAVALTAVYVGFHLLGQIPGGAWSATLTLGQGLFILMLAPAFFEPLRELAAVWHDKAAGEAALEAIARLRAAGVALPGAMEAKGEATRGGGDPVTEVADVAEGATGVDDSHAAEVDVRTPGTALRRAASLRRAADPGRRAMAPVEVEVRGLTVRHGDAAPAIGGLDLEVYRGEHVALCGASGAGKSTLLAALAGLLPATAGEIRLDGRALTAANATALRARMAWMGQSPHVFAGTVHGNVSLDRPGVSAVDVREAIEFAGLGEVANAAPEGGLGERGIGLSGGELVRLALARAAVQPDAGLLLVDEPTAHLDADTAARVIDALLLAARGRTLIVATHDPALIRRMHRVIELVGAGAGASPSAPDSPSARPTGKVAAAGTGEPHRADDTDRVDDTDSEDRDDRARRAQRASHAVDVTPRRIAA